MSVDYVALTSFLMRNFPDQYLFVLQYWVSSSAISKKIFDLVSREANLKTDIHTGYNYNQPMILYDVMFLPKMFPESCIPACGHCLV